MRIRLLTFGVVVFFVFCFSTLKQLASFAPEYDLLITNGRIVDGTGNPWFEGTVAIKNGRIADIGQIATHRAARVINAQGNIVAPGFIDVHAHIEGANTRVGIEKIPTADNYLQMGVTSVITGNCGGSALPLGDWFAQLEKTGISMNIGALIGHNTVRRAAMKGDYDRPPTPEELEHMRQLVQQAMQDGAVGVSTGLAYVPGTYAKTDEVLELATISARYGGIYATHMRNDGFDIEESIKEALIIGEQAKCPVEISHLKIATRANWGKSPVSIKLIEDARMRGQQVTVDQYLYTAASTGLATFATGFPSWLFEGGVEQTKAKLRDPGTRKRVKEEMIAIIKQRGFSDLSYAVVANYPTNPSFNGKSLSEITRLVHGKAGLEEEAEQAMEMVIAGGAAMVYHVMSAEDIEHIFRQPFTMVAADGSIIDMNDSSVPHPRSLGDNARALGTYVREKKLVSLEEGIRKMTSLPAQTFKLWDRGLLRPGMAADLVIFDEKTIADRATYQQPKQFPIGIEFTLVNGQVVIEKGKHTGTRPGQILRGRGKGA